MDAAAKVNEMKSAAVKHEIGSYYGGKIPMKIWAGTNLGKCCIWGSKWNDICNGKIMHENGVHNIKVKTHEKVRWKYYISNAEKNIFS